jgi:hypothetical protein
LIRNDETDLRGFSLLIPKIFLRIKLDDDDGDGDLVKMGFGEEVEGVFWGMIRVSGLGREKVEGICWWCIFDLTSSS